MTEPAVLCVWCRHFQPETRTCKAYPDGIPRAVLLVKRPHVQVLKGQSGTTTFDPTDE